MKKLYALLLTLATITNIHSQIIYSENFDSGQMPAGYVLYNLDGLTPDDPDLDTMADSAWTIKTITTQSFPGGNCAFSVSWYVGDEGPSDDWMVLPEISLGSNPYLSWLGLAITSSGDFRDQYQVFVSSSGSDIEDYILLSPVFDTGAEGELDVPTQHEISLADFAGETVNVAFRNWTQPYNADLPTGPGNGGNELAIDNITLSEGPVSTFEVVENEFTFSVFPNPMNQSSILNMGIGTFDIVLFNSFGQELKHWSKVKNQLELKREGLATGNYLVRVVDENGISHGAQLLVE
ncbi:MAG: choice-of-anchor J domain-containing protein [Flavobacteriales bacterium]|nr:choice-of-anchor J domain-containing protein [Flavobacteriales bacterium]